MGRSVGKIIILSFRVGIAKNKNIDHEVKKLVPLCQPSLFTPKFNNLKYSKYMFFYVFYCTLKEKGQIARNKNSKKRNIYIEKQYYNFVLPKMRVGRACTTKN